MKRWLFLWLSLVVSQACAFSWSDLWQTKNQQAQHLMNQGHFEKAEATFEQADWRASASYRAGHYEAAAKQFESLHTADGYYNQGNALAHQGQYKQAIDAYDKALASNPTNQDARYNRDLVRALLKKEQQKEQEQTKKDHQSNETPDNQQQNKGQDKQPDASDKPSSSNQKQPQSDLSSDKKDAKENKQPSKNEAPPAQGKPKPSKPESSHATEPPSAATREKQQAKDQWLHLIPDDPGGLMREKFLRDYLRRQREGA